MNVTNHYLFKLIIIKNRRNIIQNLIFLNNIFTSF